MDNMITVKLQGKEVTMTSQERDWRILVLACRLDRPAEVINRYYLRCLENMGEY